MKAKFDFLKEKLNKKLFITFSLVVVCIIAFFGIINIVPKNGDNSDDIAETDYDYIKERVIVQADNDKFDSYGGNVEKISEGLYTVSFDNKEDAAEACKKFEKDNISAAVDDVIEMQETETVTQEIAFDNNEEVETHSELSEYLLTKKTDKNNVTVAVLDTGFIETGFDNIDDRIISSNYNFVTSEKTVLDDNGHGTYMTQIIAEDTYSNVNILPIKVLDKNGKGTLLSLYQGIQCTIENKVDIINLSISTASKNTAFIENIIKEANDAGIIIVTSAGNNSTNTKNIFPAKLNNVITISSVNNKLTPSTFSNIGKEIDFAAIGEGYSLYNPINKTNEEVSGTSFSAAKVSAIIAKIKAIDNNYKYNDIYEILKKYAYKPNNSDSNKIGNGILTQGVIYVEDNDNSINENITAQIDINNFENWKELSDEKFSELINNNYHDNNAIFWQNLSEEDKEIAKNKCSTFYNDITINTMDELSGEQIGSVVYENYYKYLESVNLDEVRANSFPYKKNVYIYFYQNNSHNRDYKIEYAEQCDGQASGFAPSGHKGHTITGKVISTTNGFSNNEYTLSMSGGNKQDSNGKWYAQIELTFKFTNTYRVDKIRKDSNTDGNCNLWGRKDNDYQFYATLNDNYDSASWIDIDYSIDKYSLDINPIIDGVPCASGKSGFVFGIEDRNTASNITGGYDKIDFCDNVKSGHNYWVWIQKSKIPAGYKLVDSTVSVTPYTEPNGTEWYYYNLGTISSNTSFAPKWEKDNINVKFNANGGVFLSKKELELSYSKQCGSTTTVSETVDTGVTLSKPGCSFLGWSTSSTATSATYAKGSTYTYPTSDVTLYAVWGPSNGQKIVIGGSANDVVIEYNSIITDYEATNNIDIPAAANKTFNCYTGSPSGLGTKVIDNKGFINIENTHYTNNATVYGQWTNGAPSNAKVIYHSNEISNSIGDTVEKTVSAGYYSVSSPTSIFGTSTDKYYNFGTYWTTTVNGSTKVFAGQSIEVKAGEVIHLYAVKDAKSFTVKGHMYYEGVTEGNYTYAHGFDFATTNIDSTVSFKDVYNSLSFINKTDYEFSKVAIKNAVKTNSRTDLECTFNPKDTTEVSIYMKRKTFDVNVQATAGANVKNTALKCRWGTTVNLDGTLNLGYYWGNPCWTAVSGISSSKFTVNTNNNKTSLSFTMPTNAVTVKLSAVQSPSITEFYTLTVDPNGVDENGSSVTGAKWIDGSNTYTSTATFNMYQYNMKTLNKPIHDGYTFVEWEIIKGTETGSSISGSTFKMGAGDTSIRAVWKPIPNCSYTINYRVQDIDTGDFRILDTNTNAVKVNSTITIPVADKVKEFIAADEIIGISNSTSAYTEFKKYYTVKHGSIVVGDSYSTKITGTGTIINIDIIPSYKYNIVYNVGSGVTAQSTIPYNNVYYGISGNYITSGSTANPTARYAKNVTFSQTKNVNSLRAYGRYNNSPSETAWRANNQAGLIKTGYNVQKDESWYWTDASGNKHFVKGGALLSSSESVAMAKRANELGGTLVLNLNWVPNIYEITLDKNSGANGTDKFYERYADGYYAESVIKIGTTPKITTITPPTKTGYTFLGYYYEPDCGGIQKTNGTGLCSKTQVVNASGKIVVSNTFFNKYDYQNAYTLHAHWKPNTYNVYLYPNRPTNPKSLSDVTISKSNYTSTDYKGWKWDVINKRYYRTFTYSDNSDRTTIGVNPDEMFALTGYTIDKVNFYTGTNPNGTGKGTRYTLASGNLASAQGATVNLYPGWTDNVPTISNTYKKNVCNTTQTFTVTVGDTGSGIKSYTMNGCGVNKSYTYSSGTVSSSKTETVTVNKEGTLTITVTDFNDKTTTSTITFYKTLLDVNNGYIYGKTAGTNLSYTSKGNTCHGYSLNTEKEVITSTGTRAGNTFLGWNTTASATTASKSITVAANNTTRYYAIWKDEVKPVAVIDKVTNNTSRTQTITFSLYDTAVNGNKTGSDIAGYYFGTNPIYDGNGNTYKAVACDTTYGYKKFLTETVTPTAKTTYYIFAVDKAGNVSATATYNGTDGITFYKISLVPNGSNATKASITVDGVTATHPTGTTYLMVAEANTVTLPTASRIGHHDAVSETDAKSNHYATTSTGTDYCTTWKAVSDKTLYARWTANRYTVRLCGNKPVLAINSAAVTGLNPKDYTAADGTVTKWTYNTAGYYQATFTYDAVHSLPSANDTFKMNEWKILGWYTSNGMTGSKYDGNGTLIQPDIKVWNFCTKKDDVYNLYVHWEDNSVPGTGKPGANGSQTSTENGTKLTETKVNTTSPVYSTATTVSDGAVYNATVNGNLRLLGNRTWNSQWLNYDADLTLTSWDRGTGISNLSIFDKDGTNEASKNFTAFTEDAVSATWTDTTDGTQQFYGIATDRSDNSKDTTKKPLSTTTKLITTKIDKTGPSLVSSTIKRGTFQNPLSDSNLATSGSTYINGVFNPYSMHTSFTAVISDKKGTSTDVSGVKYAWVEVYNVDDETERHVYEMSLKSGDRIQGTWWTSANLYHDFVRASKVKYSIHAIDEAGNYKCIKTASDKDSYNKDLLTINIKATIVRDDVLTSAEKNYFLGGQTGKMTIETYGYVESVDVGFNNNTQGVELQKAAALDVARGLNAKKFGTIKYIDGGQGFIDPRLNFNPATNPNVTTLDNGCYRSYVYSFQVANNINDPSINLLIKANNWTETILSYKKTLVNTIEIAYKGSRNTTSIAPMKLGATADDSESKVTTLTDTFHTSLYH